ncbi:MAG: deoxyribonuclease [Candidatus Dependentiae bacterium]|nr:deoxyribonuclease [Candidatus Dependentiae bacterium]
MKKDLFGAHLSIAGGLETVFKRAAVVGAHAVQIFTKSNKSYFAKPLVAGEITAFTEAWNQSGVAVVVTHAAYLINLAASDAAVEKKSIASLRAEVERCVQLCIPYLVLHPGAHTGGGIEVGVEKIAQNLSAVLSEVPGDTMILLETAAGQGTAVGSTFEELRAIYDACDTEIKHRVGICFDTCHVFAVGYDLSSIEAYRSVMEKFDAIVGRKLLKVVHLNDSQTVCGSRKDRHANLGKGHIPQSVLHAIAHEMSERGIAVVLETPSVDGISEYAEEITFLRS